MAYERIDRGRVRVQPLAARASKHTLAEVRLDPDGPLPPIDPPLAAAVDRVAGEVRRARGRGAAVILAYGAHLVKNGLGPTVARMLEGGWVTHLATNGAGAIHDWEYAFQGASEEDVRAHVAAGCFGTWDETGRSAAIAVLCGALEGMGYGESMGRFIWEEGCPVPGTGALERALAGWAGDGGPDELMPARAELLHFLRRCPLPAGRLRLPHPHREFSLAAQAYRRRVPLTVHPGIGYDIIYTHPLASGAAMGRAGDIDFQVMARSVSRLEGGVFLSVGSAIMAPQVFEKALSVANNLRRQDGLGPLAPFIVVNDLVAVEWDWSRGEPPADSAAYYVRFCKSFSRMGGELLYAGGDNRTFVRHLAARLQSETGSPN
ncbi:MAG: hypothetical protein ABIL09_29090 [Gemmatimonadota bacterium]